MIGVTTPKHLAAIIDARRDPLRWSRAQFALAVLTWWEKQGCPAVDPIDASGMKLRALSAAEGKGDYGSKRAG